MGSLSIFEPEFLKTVVILEISSLDFAYYKIPRKKQKCLNLGPKMPYFGIFELEFLKTIVIFVFSTLEFV